MLEALGIWSQHIESHPGGWPDRYFGGGKWIEFKAILFSRKPQRRRPPLLRNLLQRSQKKFIPELIKRGDQVFVCVFVHIEDEPLRFLILEYEDFLETNESQLDKQAVPWSNALEVVGGALRW